MGHEVVGEEREPVEVGELDHLAEVQVGGGDLGALVERHRAAVVLGHVALERGEVGQHLDQADGRAAGAGDHVEPVAGVLGPDALAQRAQRVGPQPHELVAGVLAGDGGDLGVLDRGQLARAPGPAVDEALAQRGGQRAVAGQARALAQRGEPARAEVDRVEGQEKGRAGLERAEHEVQLGVEPGAGGGQLQRARVGPDGLLADAHGARASGHPGAGAADVVDEGHRRRL